MEEQQQSAPVEAAAPPVEGQEIEVADDGSIEIDLGEGKGKVRVRVQHRERPPWPKVNEIRTQRELSPFITSLLFDEPFFGHIFRHVNFSATDALDTAGVLVKDSDLFMLWNPDFMSSLTNKQVRGLLKHEAFHLVFQHCTKRSLTPHNVANLAADLAINCAIPDDELPPGGWLPGVLHKDPFTGKPDDSAVAKAVSKFPKHKSMEWYFTKLMEDSEAKAEMASPGFVLEGFDDHGGWGELKPEEAELVKGKLGELLKGAIAKADRSNSWGSIPAEMREQLREMVSNEIDWRAVLRQFVKASKRGTSTSTWTNLHMSNLHEDMGPASPGKKRGFTSNVAVYIDESGSMADEWISLLIAELANFSRRTTFPMYVFDTEVDEKTKVVWKGRGGIPRAALTRQRCGGTDFEAPTKHAHSGKIKDLDGYLILTDGGAAKPTKSRVRRGYVLAPGQELAFTPDPEDFVIRLKRDAEKQ
jgi:predicted metal-dependent peptidase